MLSLSFAEFQNLACWFAPGAGILKALTDFFKIIFWKHNQEILIPLGSVREFPENWVNCKAPYIY